MNFYENLNFNEELELQKTENYTDKQLLENISDDSLINKIQDSESYFVRLWLNNYSDRRNIIESLKNTNYIIDDLDFRDDRIYAYILSNLTDDVMNKLNKMFVENEYDWLACLFKNRTEQENYLDMIIWYQVWLHPSEFIFKFERKELLYTLLILTSILKDNPELKDKRIWLILNNFNNDEIANLYSIHSMLQIFFNWQSKYNFLWNCKFIIPDTNEWKRAYKYFEYKKIWDATKDRIWLLSDFIKI